jgi:hypothetical protein
MSYELVSLEGQCQRWGVVAIGVDRLRMVHMLLAAMPPDPRVLVQFGGGHDWQLLINGRLICGGGLEECVVRLAAGTAR